MKLNFWSKILLIDLLASSSWVTVAERENVLEDTVVREHILTHTRVVLTSAKATPIAQVQEYISKRMC